MIFAGTAEWKAGQRMNINKRILMWAGVAGCLVCMLAATGAVLSKRPEPELGSGEKEVMMLL